MKRKKLVIIGGGFTGSLVAKKLESKFETTLIDKKNYFEFTPGILRSIVDPTHLMKLQIKHKNYLKHTLVEKDEVKKINKNNIKTQKRTVDFDYLVLASGSSYHTPIKEYNVLVASNSKVLNDNYDALCKAKKVLIVGGGIVGVELTAEIVKRYSKEIKNKDKQVDLIHSHNKLMQKQNKKSCIYAKEFLIKNGINIIFEKRCTNDDTKGYDLVFHTTGIKPNSSFIDKKNLDKRGFVIVDSKLKVKDTNNIFAGGDLTNIKEEKLAQASEAHAEIIIKNIMAQENGEELTDYKISTYPKVISLGKYNGILEYKNIIIKGLFPGLLKTLIEKYHLLKFRFF